MSNDNKPFREELKTQLQDMTTELILFTASFGKTKEPQHMNSNVDNIIKLITDKIDKLIQHDERVISQKLGTKAGQLAAQQSKNTLLLVKEMLTTKK